MFRFLLACLLALACVVPAFAESHISLERDTPIVLETDEVVSIDRNQAGESVRLKVQADVTVQGQILVKKDAVAEGTLEIEKGGPGSRGILVINITSVTAVDGTLVPCVGRLGGNMGGSGAKSLARWIPKGTAATARVATASAISVSSTVAGQLLFTEKLSRTGARPEPCTSFSNPPHAVVVWWNLTPELQSDRVFQVQWLRDGKPEKECRVVIPAHRPHAWARYPGREPLPAGRWRVEIKLDGKPQYSGEFTVGKS